MPDELIITTKDTIGEYDAIETAKPGEPLFPLQGGDPFGPPTVLHWVRLCREAGMREQDEKKSITLLTKARDAELVAWAMLSYQRGQAELPNVESTRPAFQAPSVAVVSEERAERATLIRGVAALQNAVGTIATFADELAAYSSRADDARDLHALAELVNSFADKIEPRRGNERT